MVLVILWMNFNRGDLVKVTQNGSGDNLGLYHIGKVVGHQIELIPVWFSKIDDQPLRSDVLVTVIRSGNANRLTQQAGSFTTYGELPEVVAQ